ncbi:MAG: autotransporter domain-containing protein, partial [Betaproteobacteria bacterium]|nr:autotransporter domain-containing protein [Betaproteobacteria bacterium]
MAPAAGATTLSVQMDTPSSVDLAPLISGTALLGIRIVTAPTNGTAVVSGTRVTYTPARGYLGADAFTYESFSATTSSPAATVSVSVVSRADPMRDPRVKGLVVTRAQTARRFARAQVFNLQQRMDSLHGSLLAAAPPPGGLRPVASVVAQPALVASAAPAFSAASFLTGLFNVASAGSLKLSYSSDRSGSPLALPEGVGVWLGGNIRFGTRDLSSDSAGLRFDSEGISFGVDRRFSDALLLGLGVGYGRGTTDIGEDGSKNSASGRSVMLYGSYRFANKAFLDGLLGYGVLDLDTQRFIPAANEFARANRKGDQVFGSIAAGYELRGQGILLSPYGRLDFSNDRLKQATESGEGLAALTYFEQKLASQQLALGLRAESQHRTRFGWALPRLRVEYRHELSGDRGAMIGYADQPGGPTYSITPADGRRGSLAVGVGSDFLMAAGLKLGIDYQVERQSAAERSHALRFLLSKSLDGRTATAGLTEARLFGRLLDVEASY